MSLVELMIGMALGLFLTTVMSAVYVGSKVTFNAQDSAARLQENGRFVVDLLANDLRMAGFRGCAGQAGGQGAVNNVLATPTALLQNFGRGVNGSHYAAGAWSPALDAALVALAPNGSGDVVTVYRSTGSGWALTAEMSSASADLQITPTAQIGAGDLLLVSDCSGAAVFQATNATPGTTGVVQHKAGASGIAPGLSGDSLGRPYLQDAVLYRLQTVSYYLAASVRRSGQLALWSYAWPTYGLGVQPVELVTGVERMAVTYGVDTNADLAADQYFTADLVPDWTQVVSARVELLLAGSELNTVTAPQPYTFGGVTVTPTDRRMRTVVSLVGSLRNAVP
jgi:type IV pilus assembly protein PilW